MDEPGVTILRDGRLNGRVHFHVFVNGEFCGVLKIPHELTGMIDQLAAIFNDHPYLKHYRKHMNIVEHLRDAYRNRDDAAFDKAIQDVEDMRAGLHARSAWRLTKACQQMQALCIEAEEAIGELDHRGDYADIRQRIRECVPTQAEKDAAEEKLKKLLGENPVKL